jgi:hypothetical protein
MLIDRFGWHHDASFFESAKETAANLREAAGVDAQ